MASNIGKIETCSNINLWYFSGTPASDNVPGNQKELWYENTGTYFTLTKNSWIRIAKLKSSSYTKALAFLSVQQAGSMSTLCITEMNVPVPAFYFSTIEYEAKMDIDGDGYIGIYLKLTSNASWTTLPCGFGSQTGYIYQYYICPI